MPDSPDGTSSPTPYVRDIATTNDRDAATRGTPMTAEIDLLIAAQDRQAGLLAEAEARRLTRRTDAASTTPQRPVGARLNTLIRRLAGAPSFS